MDLFKLDIAEIGELTSTVAVNGAIRVIGTVGDDMFEYIVAVAVLVYEMYPNT